MPLNIELFKKIRERIATIPESYSQYVFIKNSPVAPCGTVCCIAGDAIICNAATVADGIASLRQMDDTAAPDDSQWGQLIPHVAQDLLGLDDAEAAVLFEFAENHWPEPFRGGFILADSDAERSRVAVAFLDHIIETGKVLE